MVGFDGYAQGFDRFHRTSRGCPPISDTPGFPRRVHLLAAILPMKPQLPSHGSWTPESGPAAHPLERQAAAPLCVEASRARAFVAMTLLCAAIAGCSSAPQQGSKAPGDQSIDAIAAELEAMSGSILSPHEDTFRSILEGAIDKDAFVCRPSPRVVFGSGAIEGERVIRGVMPHYGFYYGPMQYLVRRLKERWEVEVRVAVEPPPESATLELPDCGMKAELGAELACSGTPYPLSGSLDACPGSGIFRARATALAVQALLRRWSSETERYWNRDAEAFGVPVRYDFDFVLIDEANARGLRVDIEMPLSPTCGRTPYFQAMRSGWSMPIIAHEVGHVMGLLDEYEALSGLVSFYPKTPFRGAERSRMGISMKEHTKILPLHHYLILRRYFCAEPRQANPYAHAL